MTPGATENPLALLPEIILLGGAVVGLLTGLFLPRRRQWIVRLIAAAALLGAIAATAAAMTRDPTAALMGEYAVDAASNTARLVVCAATLLVLCLSVDGLAGHRRETEFYTLLLFAALGAVLLGGARDLLLLSVGYLLASIPAYALVGFGKDALGTEAALKFYLLGALFGVVLLAGVTVLYGVAGGTDYTALRAALPAAARGPVIAGGVAVLAGLLFKVGAVPVQFWVPDAAQAALTPVAGFVTTIPKVGALVAAYRLLAEPLAGGPGDWPLLVALVAAASMTLGNLAAFYQDDARRLLGYSTISQVGYLLMAVAVAARSDLALRALALYLAAYAVTNLGAFAVVAELPRARRLGDYAGLFARRRLLALSLVVCLLGLVGTPPTGGFVGKLAVFSAAGDGALGWLVVVAAVNTVVSLFYYLRWIGPLFLAARPAPAPVQILAGAWGRVGAYSAAVASVLVGIGSGVVFAAVGSGRLAG